MSRWAVNQGYFVLFKGPYAGTPPCNGFLLQQNGDKILQQDDFGILVASECSPGALLQQNDDFLLQENDFKILT